MLEAWSPSLFLWFRQFVRQQLRLEGEIVGALQVPCVGASFRLLHVFTDLSHHVLLTGIELAPRQRFQIRLRGCQQKVRA